MKYLLDTNAIIGLLKGHRGLSRQFHQHPPDSFVISALVVHELFYGPYDVLIAGQASARNLTLITRNLREFERVPKLNTEDWNSH